MRPIRDRDGTGNSGIDRRAVVDGPAAQLDRAGAIVVMETGDRAQPR